MVTLLSLLSFFVTDKTEQHNFENSCGNTHVNKSVLKKNENQN